MRWVTAFLVLGALLVSGCSSDGDGTTTGPTGTMTGTTSATPTTGTGTTTGAAIERANLTADRTQGTAPLSVQFGIGATGSVRSWTLTYGDGSAVVTGTARDMPGTRSHTYAIGGSFTANLNVTFTNGRTASDTVRIAVQAPEQGEAPDQLLFEYGPSAGCVGDFAVCISYVAGASQPPIDGFWQALDSRYWGLPFTTTVETVLGDSDCVFVNDAGEEIGEAHNGSDVCEGTIPAGTSWIFLYPYAEPSEGMTLSFEA